MIDLAVITVAGQGTRMLPATKSLPKEMLPLGRKPAVHYLVDELARSSVRRFLFVTSAGKSAIENHFDDDRGLVDRLRSTGRETELGELDYLREDLEFCYTRQHQPLGLGHAVLCAEPFVGDAPFVVALGDTIIGLRGQTLITERLVHAMESAGADLAIAFDRVEWEETEKYGIAVPHGSVRAQFGAQFDLAGLIEKPPAAQAPSQLAVVGRYAFRPSIFQSLRSTAPGRGGEIQLTDAIHQLIKSGAKAVGVCLNENERRYDVGNFADYFRSFLDFSLADEEHGAELRRYLSQVLAELQPC